MYSRSLWLDEQRQLLNDARFTFVTLLINVLSKNESPLFIKTAKLIYQNRTLCLVETTGIEPVTSSLQSWRSPN